MSLSLAPWEKSVQYYKVYVPWIAGVLWPVLLLLLFSNLIVNSGVNIVLWMCRMIQPKYSTKVLFYCVSAKLNWNHWFQWSVKRTLFLLLKSVAFSSLILGSFVPFVFDWVTNKVYLSQTQHNPFSQYCSGKSSYSSSTKHILCLSSDMAIVLSFLL